MALPVFSQDSLPLDTKVQQLNCFFCSMLLKWMRKENSVSKCSKINWIPIFSRASWHSEKVHKLTIFHTTLKIWHFFRYNSTIKSYIKKLLWAFLTSSHNMNKITFFHVILYFDAIVNKNLYYWENLKIMRTPKTLIHFLT